MPRLSLVLILLSTAAAAQPVRLSASVGAAGHGLAAGTGPGVAVSVEGPEALGRLLLAARFDVRVIDRAALAADYTYDDASATCSDSGNAVADYLCNPLQEGNDVLGSYAVEVGYLPPLPVTLALGSGVRFAEVIEGQEGKVARVQPYVVATALVPVAGRLAVEARGQLGFEFVGGTVGLSARL